MILTPADGKTDDERFVLAFLDLWDKQDVDGLIASFTQDATYKDMPLPPRVGLDAIRAYIERIFSAFGVRIETAHIATTGSVIFTERIDYLTQTGPNEPTVPLPVTGVMEMRDGKIAFWRDYLDLRTAEEGLGIKIRADVEGQHIG
ncbi:limonene-1,2-epoxide hydrolase [Sphingobium sp. TA15]|uniref:Putative limonene-1,2-epoxide hydrolase n=1 Tax=Sphingobium indicum (strain DSM 16413 / CCM 7287 / MTCC 6362 / UT26 / NBRC 101211 / UT26S) TaxID=452662 RepID=D4Z2H3_SPHIU|nr:nuclear transport factor 2 family protein [Sphingobium indicum]BAI96805.1 putative limonene-1,2-epoxide hydrolase [Sphingobium indicum UT26S]BDD66241.1 limonene-1,2-epoxide hydrolase [Sphingobium sp. TA15]